MPGGPRRNRRARLAVARQVGGNRRLSLPPFLSFQPDCCSGGDTGNRTRVSAMRMPHNTTIPYPQIRLIVSKNDVCPEKVEDECRVLPLNSRSWCPQEEMNLYPRLRSPSYYRACHCLCPQEELNLYPRLRSPLFYPLNYRGTGKGGQVAPDLLTQVRWAGPLNYGG